MAKKREESVETTGTPRIYKLTGDVRDKLRGAGFQELWTVKPKTQAAVLACWMSPERRYVIVQQYQNGSTSLFEEVSEAQFWAVDDTAA